MPRGRTRSPSEEVNPGPRVSHRRPPLTTVAPKWASGNPIRPCEIFHKDPLSPERPPWNDLPPSPRLPLGPRARGQQVHGAGVGLDHRGHVLTVSQPGPILPAVGVGVQVEAGDGAGMLAMEKRLPSLLRKRF